MDAKKLAMETYMAQRATLGDYAGGKEQYINDLVELAEENQWLEGIDEAEFRKWLDYYVS